MIGETTLAMLYVPLLFYLFDRLAEGKDKGAASPAPARIAPPPPQPRREAAGLRPHAPRETD